MRDVIGSTRLEAAQQVAEYLLHEAGLFGFEEIRVDLWQHEGRGLYFAADVMRVEQPPRIRRTR